MPGEEFDVDQGVPLDPYAQAAPPPAPFGPQQPAPVDTSGYAPWDWLGDPSADAGAAPPVTPPEGPAAAQLDGGQPSSPPIPPEVDPSLLAAPPAPDLGAPPPFAGSPDVALPAGPPAAPPLPGAPDIGAAPPEPPPPFGPTYDVSHLPGVSIRPETHADQYTGHPWDNPNTDERDAAAERLAINDPVAFQRYSQHLAESKEATRAAAQAQADQDNLATIKQDIADRQKADAIAQAKSDAITADAIKLAGTKTDPDRYMNNRSSGQRVVDIITAVLGGLIAGRTGGPNVGLQMIQKRIDADIDAQRQDIENGKASLGLRQGAVAQEYQRTGNLYQAAEVVRMATYQAAINKIQTDQQNFDPRGTSFRDRGQLIQGLVGAQAQAQETQRKELHTESLAEIKEQREQALAASTIAHQAAETAKLRGALGGAGNGSGTNPNYTVATGFFNPYTNEPILGKRQIGGKGEDPKERNQVDAQIGTYAHVQDYWQKLAAIGNEIGNAKTAGESVWKARKSTLGAEYDTAREALTVYLTKELGDKLTQGQLEAQAHRIPERVTLFEARDPAKQIVDAQADADRDFARDMNIHGIDATPIITAAQTRRTNVRPSAEQALGDAQAAIAANPNDKDAHAALAAAHKRVQDEVTQARQHKQDVAAVGSIQQAPRPLVVDAPNPEFRTDEYTTAGKEANLAIDRYGALLRKFHEEGPKASNDRLGAIASDVLHAKELADSKAQEFAHEQALRSLYERSARSNALVGAGRGGELEQRLQEHPGADPSLDVSRAPPPAPSVVPGVDELLPPGQSYRPPAPPKKAKR
jgi:hypothetical protein